MNSETKANLTVGTIVICIFLFIGFSCVRGSRETTTVTRLDHVTRVFMHDAGWYTFYTRNPAQGDTVAVHSYGRYTDVTLLADVPAERPMWVEVTERSSTLNGSRYRIVIHLRHGGEIEGAAWDYGKGGHGTTVVVAQ